MNITANTVVALNYELRENDAQGTFVEKTDTNSPMVFIYGIGSMIPDFEANIANLKAGDTFAFGIQAENAYGPVFPDAVVEIPRSVFAGHEDMLVANQVIPMRNDQGEHVMGTIQHVGLETIRMDFNHPMAGKNLWFSGDIVSVRTATAEELDHGHVHGDGGVQH